MPKAERTRPHGDDLLAAAQGHGQAAQVQAVELAGGATKHEQAGRRVVGDRVDDLDVPIADAAADDFQRRNGVGGRTQEIRYRGLLLIDVAVQDERDLRLDPRLHDPACRDRQPIAHRHVGEQHPEVRLMHTKLPLHLRRGQPDLAANQPAASGQRALGVEVLHRIGGIEVIRHEQVADWWARLPIGGLPKLIGCPGHSARSRRGNSGRSQVIHVRSLRVQPAGGERHG